MRPVLARRAALPAGLACAPHRGRVKFSPAASREGKKKGHVPLFVLVFLSPINSLTPAKNDIHTCTNAERARSKSQGHESERRGKHGELALRRTARGSARGDRHNARGERGARGKPGVRGAPATPLRSPMRLPRRHALPRPSALTHRHTAPQTQRVSWCARAEQRYAKDAPLLPSEVRALFTDVFDNVLNRQLGYTDEENERVLLPARPAFPLLPIAPSPPHPLTVAPPHRFPVHPLSTPTHCFHLRT